MPAPKVSVITPCYRQASFLPATIESVLRQSHHPVEMLVVNDGSDDDTEEVVAKYADRITYLWKSNGGQSSARNLGLKHATGDYVLFLDADDLLHRDALSWLVEAASTKFNPLCVMGCRAFQGDPNRVVEEWLPPAIPSLLPWLIHRNCGPPHCLMAPLQMVQDAGGFDEKLAGCEDWDLWLRLALRGAQLVTIPRVGAYYRRYEGSFSTCGKRMLADRVEVLLRFHRRAFQQHGHLGREEAIELLDTEYRVLRRCLVQHADAHHITELAEAIAELHRSGLCLKKSFRRRLLEAVLGGLGTEKLVLGFFRRFRPRRYLEYQQGYL